MGIININDATSVPKLIKCIKEILPRTEVKSIICSVSRKESVLRELQSRKSRRFIVLLYVVWIVLIIVLELIVGKVKWDKCWIIK